MVETFLLYEHITILNEILLGVFFQKIKFTSPVLEFGLAEVIVDSGRKAAPHQATVGDVQMLKT